MYYTSHGLMTAEDMAEVRADYDLDLCTCCENGDFDQGGPDGDSWWCRNCEDDLTNHAGHEDALNEPEA